MGSGGLYSPFVRGSHQGSEDATFLKPCSLMQALKGKVLVAQSYLTLCNPLDCSPPGSSVPGILQASPGDLPNPGVEPGSPALQADSLPSMLPGKPKEDFCYCCYCCCSVTQSCPTLCDPMDCSTPALPVFHQTHSSTLAGKSHGQRCRVGYSPWGHKESDTTT